MKANLVRMIFLITVIISAAGESLAQQYQYNAMLGRHEYTGKKRDFMADYSKAKAAGKNLTGFLRSEEAYSVLFTSFDYQQSFTRSDFQTGETTHDTSFSLDLRTRARFGVSSTTSAPICDFGDNAALLFSYGLMVNYFKLETDSLYLGNNYHSYGLRIVQFGAPLTIDYKTGCEAMLDKSKRTTMGFGLGFIPMINSGLVNFGDGSADFRLYPYAKAEFGVFWKVCLKLRASCQFGQNTFLSLDNYGGNHYERNAISLKSGPIFGLSLVLMPLAFDWNELGWY